MLYRLRKRELLHLNDKPTHCHWCTGMLRGLRNICKGQNCSRHYCSQGCLREGEERAARYALAGSSPHAVASEDRQNRIDRSNTSHGDMAAGIPALEKALVGTASRDAVPTRPQGLPTKLTMVPDGGTAEVHH